MVNVRQAKEAARQWVRVEASTAPDFCGAFYHGSAAWLPDDATLPATSDVDVIVVRADPNPPAKPGKFSYREVLLDVSYLPAADLASPDLVLGLSHLAGSFRAASIIQDPTGHLGQLQAAVARDYARRRWVYARCEHASDKILAHLATLQDATQLHDGVMSWLFATGVMTHVLLVAGLENPTVRRRYVAVRDLLARYGRTEFYDTLLEALGCAGMSRARVEAHLAELVAVFDAAAAVLTTPVPFAADLSKSARRVAIDGSRELIERGDHREAMFWIAVTYSRCQTVLYHDGTMEMQERYGPAYRRMLGDLGIASLADVQARGAEVRRLLPRVWEVAEAIIAANPEVEG